MPTSRLGFSDGRRDPGHLQAYAGPSFTAPPLARGTLKKTWLWWSSGKDSAWSLRELRQAEDFTVDALVTTVTPAFGRVAIHGTRLEVLRAQAAAVGLPLRIVELPYPCTNADYESAVASLVSEAESLGVTHMAFGDLFLQDIRDYRIGILKDSTIEPVFPIWGVDTAELAQGMIAGGVRARIVSLDPNRVDRRLIGAAYDRALLAALGPDVDPCGENGEFHTCVVDSPDFKAPIAVASGESVEREGFLYHDLCLEQRDGSGS